VGRAHHERGKYSPLCRWSAAADKSRAANWQAARRPRSGGDDAQHRLLAGLAWRAYNTLWPDGVGLGPVLIKGGQRCSYGLGPFNNFY
jgi:hypothetical protein